uniref:Gamma-glutamyltransferase 5a n=1 Tax=Scleropages formosus TaxID=113540 RepID=A0A8C9T0R6_SCLFO
MELISKQVICMYFISESVCVCVCVCVCERERERQHALKDHNAMRRLRRFLPYPFRDILQQGGSAVDGAIAALLCTSLLNPQSMGLGGGSIFTVREKSGKVTVINSRETVPKVFKADLLKDCPVDFQMGRWIGVPGEIRGYERAHSLFGRLPWATLFQPIIKLAREGIALPTVLNRYLLLLRKLGETSPLRKLFSNENGTLLKEGDMLRFKQLADTLEVIANQGPDAFYRGKIARDLIQDVQDAGGTLSLEDLESYKVKVMDAWPVTLGDYDMYVPPPPAGGAVLSFVLNIMKGYDLDPSSVVGEQKTLMYHRYVEACKFANSRKRSIRDPAFSSDTEAFRMTKDELADSVRGKISSNKTHNSSHYSAGPSWDHMGTTHVSVLAEDGTAVSATSTINHIFGSKVYSPKTGVILNNQLLDFCGLADRILAGEQPPSSMAPVILHSATRQKTLVIGASGGSMITTGVASAIMNHLWFGKDLKEAISAPVVFVDSKNALKFEPDFDQVKRQHADRTPATAAAPPAARLL